MCVIKLLIRDLGSSLVLGEGLKIGDGVRLKINGNCIYNSLIQVIHPKFLYRCIPK